MGRIETLPLATHHVNPYEGDWSDWFYHDPRTDTSGVITFLTIRQTLYDMWSRSNWVGGEEICRANLLTPGIYRDTARHKDSDYNNFTIVVDSWGAGLIKEICEEKIEELNEQLTGPDFELREDKEIDDLPDIAVECEECRRTIMYSDAQVALGASGRYCEDCVPDDEPVSKYIPLEDEDDEEAEVWEID